MSETADTQTRATEFLQGLMERMGIDGQINAREEDDKLLIDIECDNAEKIIGRRGQVIDAIQHLVTKVAYQGTRRGEGKPIVIDAGGYRQRQIERLEDLARKMQEKALSTGSTVHLKPMNAHDRRIVHMTLADADDVTTASEGEGDDRHVTIIPSDS